MTTRVTNVILMAGVHSAIPASATTPEGALFSCTEHDKVYRNNGVTWDDWADLAGTGASTLTTKGDLLTRDATALDRLPVGSNGWFLTPDSAEDTGLKWAPHVEYVQVAISDETTDLTTGTAKVTMRMPFALNLTEVRASLATTSSSGTPTFDINDGGVSILSTKITVDVGEKTSVTAVAPPVISDTALADDAEITFDIDTAGTGAKGAKITLIGTRP